MVVPLPLLESHTLGEIGKYLGVTTNQHQNVTITLVLSEVGTSKAN